MQRLLFSGITLGLFVVFLPFLLMFVTAASPYADLRDAVDDDEAFQVLVRRAGEKDGIGLANLRETAHMNAYVCGFQGGALWTQVTDGRLKLKTDQASCRYAITSINDGLGVNTRQVQLSCGMREYHYEIKKGCVYPLKRKLPGFWQAFIAATLAAVMAGLGVKWIRAWGLPRRKS